LAQIKYRREREEKTVRMTEVISTMIMKINVVSKWEHDLQGPGIIYMSSSLIYHVTEEFL